MEFGMKKIFCFAIFACFSFSAFSQEFNLDTAKKQLVNDNVNIAIAYQNYISVKEEGRSKTLQLLPSLSLDMLVADYQYTILRSIIPEPSQFFTSKASKDLAGAASLNISIVRKNLLEDLEKTYFLYQFHKEIVESLAKELTIRKNIADRSKEAYDLGAIKFSDYYIIQRELINARSNHVTANEILKNDEFALRLILQVDGLAEFSLAWADLYNENLIYPPNVTNAAIIAVNNSKEIEQYDYLTSAAVNTKKGTAISWLSWGGVGFDYFARVSIARSEITKLELQKKKATIELKNQVAVLYSEITKLKEGLGFQEQLLQMAQENYKVATENNNDQLGTLIAVKQAELSLMNVERDTRRMQYEVEFKLIKLKRILGTNMLTNEIPKA
jgi:outer membrane protein TolC